MATFKIYKLHFTAPLHISDLHEDLGNSQKIIQSDTLYAALMSGLAKQGEKLPDDGNLGFTVSSLFPYFQKDKDSTPVYFLPIPMQARLAELADVSKAKKVKKVQWVDSALYSSILSGESLFDRTDKYVSNIQESYLTTFELPEDINGNKEFINSEVSQRVTLKSRTGEEDAKPFYVDKILFRHHAGLYFIAEGDTALLEKALQLLSMEGIGTDRNVGYGFFEYTADTLSIDLPDAANHQLSLSLFIPESKEQLVKLMNSERVAYDFVRRGGWITTYPYMTLRKNAIYGFLPGSVFHKEEGQATTVVGKIVDLKPKTDDVEISHPVWRNGRAIMLPIIIK
ncbi:MAG: type III-A CRISPR-associated RAMP protein Csm4 [Prevotella sp.]|nr:type III-A CRISPR-associated RAMP protein Csm4 [Prevotella sp.]MBR1463521.1 type III-A CRISPR-associated RAMP protein Csm4 [Prevotella sp.]